MLVNRALLEFVDRVTPANGAHPGARRGPERSPGPRRLLYCPHRSGSATPGATSRSPERCGERCDVQVDWLAQHPVTTFLADAGERVHPASALSRERVGAHRERVARARPARLPGDPPDGRDPGPNFSVVQDARRRRRLRPRGRRRGLGPGPLLAREPRAQARRIRLDDRLRRLAAHAGRRGARGAAHRRLQRRDDRARRAVPPGARPVDLRRRPRRHRAGRLRSGPAVRSARGPSSTTTSPATSPVSTRSPRPTGPRCGAGSASRATLPWSSSPSVGQASAAPCCARLSTPTRGCARRSTGCGCSSSPAHGSTSPRCRRTTASTSAASSPDLPPHLAACDAAIVQGGLTTTMELVATGRPFLYFPLGHHFEQQRHVRHRLDRHRAGRCMDYGDDRRRRHRRRAGRRAGVVAATTCRCPRTALRARRSCSPS